MSLLIFGNGREMYRYRFLPFLSMCSSRSTPRLSFSSNIHSSLGKCTKFMFCGKGRPKPSTGGERGVTCLSGIFGWPQGDLLTSTVYHHRKIMNSSLSSEKDLTKVLEHFISNEKCEACCIKEMFSIYIEKLCKLRNLRDAVNLFRCLHDKQIHPDLHTYNTLLAAAGEANSFDLFCDIFQKLLLLKLPPDLTTYSNVVKTLLSLSDSNALLKFIRSVSEVTVNSDPTVVNRIIFFTAKSGQIDKSLMMFEELKNYKCKIDTVTFNTVLAILGRAGRVDKMLSEYSLLKELGYSPDIVTYDTLINCLRRLGRLDLCKAFAKEMLGSGFELDLQSYTALIDGLGRAGHIDDAFILFVEMKKFHRPSIYVYRAMIANLRKFGNIQAAIDLLKEMNSSTSKLVGPEDFRMKRRDSLRKRKRCS